MMLVRDICMEGWFQAVCVHVVWQQYGGVSIWKRIGE